MPQPTYKEKIDANIEKVKTPHIKRILKIQSTRAAYPKDCINDGGLDLFVKEILELERKAGL